MTQFLCLMTPIKGQPPRDPHELGAIYGRHGTFLSGKGKAGVITYAGYTNGAEPGKLSFAVVTAESLDQARATMQAAPMVAEGLLALEIEPFEVFIST